MTLLGLPTEPWASMAVGTSRSAFSACRLGLVLGRLVETGLEVDDGDEPPGGRRAALEQRRRRRVGEAAGGEQGRAHLLDAGNLRPTSCVAAAPSATTVRVREVGAGHLHRQGLERRLGLLDDLAGLRRLRVDGGGARSGDG